MINSGQGILIMLIWRQRIKKTKMETQKSQVVDRLNQATNILVTVSSNPSVDQLAGAIGLTLVLNKLGKHATTVFSGSIPSAIEFLQPEKTIEKNTDSLRDFIIALDKSKADKLRYKVEDQMVKIFITPYMTSISEKDLEFSQGDFNVDVIVALGVREQQDLDQAITSHGRILHDATLIGISTEADLALGSINWNDPAASSLSEMLAQLSIAMKADIFDSQMSTALLTGIVAETNRFSNEKTSAETMQVSARLMAAGANQQLVASQLQPQVQEVSLQNDEASPELPQIEGMAATDNVATDAEPYIDGTLRIAHEELKSLGLDSDIPAEETPEQPKPDGRASDQPDNESQTDLPPEEEEDSETSREVSEPEMEQTEAAPSSSGFITNPPTLGGTLTANGQPEITDPGTDLLGPTEKVGPMLSHGKGAGDAAETTETEEPEKDETVPLPEVPFSETSIPDSATLKVADPTTDVSIEPAEAEVDSPAPLAPPALDTSQPPTLADLERSVSSAQDPLPVVEEPQTTTIEEGIDAARDAVSQAMSGSAHRVIEPIKSLNAHPMDLNLGDIPAVNTSPASAFADTPTVIQPEPQTTPSNEIPSDPDVPASVSLGQNQDNNNGDALSSPGFSPSAPPPVPPPMMPPMAPPPGSDDPTVM